MQAKQTATVTAVILGFLATSCVTTEPPNTSRPADMAKPMSVAQLVRLERPQIVQRCNVFSGATGDTVSLAIGFDRTSHQAVFMEFKYPNETSFSQEFLLIDGPLVAIDSTGAFLLPAVKGLSIMTSYVSQYPADGVTWYLVEPKANADGTSIYTLHRTQYSADKPVSIFVMKEWENSPGSSAASKPAESYELHMNWEGRE